MITTIYEQLIAEITDEDERKIFDVLLDADGRRVTREELVKEVYGVDVNSNTADGIDLAELSKSCNVIIKAARYVTTQHMIVGFEDQAMELRT